MQELAHNLEKVNLVTGFDRVRAHSADSVNARIDRETAARIAEYRGADAVAIGRRIGELDHEWDVDRALMLLFSGLGGLTFSLGLKKSRPFKKGNFWLYLFSTQVAFLGVHATVGWCPPLVVLRRLGFRTSREIDQERRALQALAATGTKPSQ